MTKAEIINRIAEQYEAKLDAFDKMLKVLKDYKIEYKLDSVGFSEDWRCGGYELSVETNDGIFVDVRLIDGRCGIYWYNDCQEYIKSEMVY
jgi:hypothetical protein